jgi:thiol-disulfide isomerase/thioredoxin
LPKITNKFSTLNKSLIYYLLAFALLYGIYKGAKYFYLKPSGTIGGQAKDFNAHLRSGESFKLSDLKGKYVLLHFWGSWCGPCRRENRELKDLYAVFNNTLFKNAKGFEIVSIGLETNEERWENAILQDGMIWKYHIVGLNSFDSELAKLYGIKQIPSSFMLDENGKILGINWTVKEINSFLALQVK